MNRVETARPAVARADPRGRDRRARASVSSPGASHPSSTHAGRSRRSTRRSARRPARSRPPGTARACRRRSRPRDQTITLSNLGSTRCRRGGDRAARQRRGADRAHGHRSARRGADARPRVARSGVGRDRRRGLAPTAKPLPPGPVVVEPFSSDVVVSAGLETATALDAGAVRERPRAPTGTSRPARRCAACRSGSCSTIPFSTDARVDVTLRTDAGLQQLPVAAGHRRARPVARRHPDPRRRGAPGARRGAGARRRRAGRRLADAAVRAGVGPDRRGDLDRRARAGEPAGGSPTARRSPGSSQWVAITDVGALDAHVDVQATLGSKAIVAPVVLTVPSGGVSWVQIGGCARRTSSCLRVARRTAATSSRSQSDASVPIVAETLSRFGDTGDRAGRDDVDGLDRRRLGDWVIAAHACRRRAVDVDLGDEHRAWTPRTSRCRSCTTASSTGPAALAAPRRSRPSARVVLPAGDRAARLVAVDAAVVITSDVPIFVESTIYAPARRDPGARHSVPLSPQSPSATFASWLRPASSSRVVHPRRDRRWGRVVARAPARRRRRRRRGARSCPSSSTGTTSRGPRRRGSSCCSRRSTATRARGCSTRRKPLESDDVSVAEVEYGAQPELHERYQIDAAPITVLVDADGVDARVVRRRVRGARAVERARRAPRELDRVRR